MEELADSDLHTAVRYEDVEAVRAALDRADCCQVNRIGLYRWSPLHEAASCGYADIVRLLLAHGADPNLADALSSSTAVHYAAKDGHVECLQHLLDAGGRYDLKDANGVTALDVASSASKTVLESRRILDLTKMTLDDARKSVAIGGLPRLGQPNGSAAASSRRSSSESVSHSSASTYTGSPDAPAPRSAWLLQASAPSGPSIGLLHASFEYHSKKRYLKIRASKLSNVSLTQESSSSIGAIYIKCKLEPDNEQTKNTKRKTEEVKVEPRTKETSTADAQTAARRYPSSFSFTKPLEYLDICENLVLEKTLRLEVCVSHRITRKSYVAGDVVMPLRAAAAKLLRETYPVRPCPYAPDAPSGMRVLAAAAASTGGGAECAGSSGKSESDPDLRLRRPLKSSPVGRLLQQLQRQRSAYRASSSDTQLREVVAIGGGGPGTPSSAGSSVSIDMEPEEQEPEPEARRRRDEFAPFVSRAAGVAGDLRRTDRASAAFGGAAAAPVVARMKGHGGNVALRTPPVDEVADNDPSRLIEVKTDGSNRFTMPRKAPSDHVVISVSPLARAAEDVSRYCAIQIPGDCVEISIENFDS